ncbi:MAG: PEP-CTERM system TPR-repeat protein PrsT, partial [Gammaproteobacteria bacterium]|nr:PEP-CTERM system TPR-repeat protein PrsT [Gammaproteobacteria bacterium]
EDNNQDLKLLLTKTYLLQGKNTSAKGVFNNIDHSTFSNKSNYQKLQGDLLFTSNKRKEAKAWYIKAIKSDNNNIEAILGAAKASLLLKQEAEVNKYTTLAIETSPTDIDALIWQARIFMLGKKYIEAENTLSRAMIELERYDILTASKYIAIDMLTKTLVAQGKIEESFTYSNYLAKSQQGKLQASYKSALDIISKGGDITEAELAFQDILKQAPKHKSSGMILGLINYQKGNYTEAEDYLSKFATDENTPLRSKKILALTKIKLNKTDSAIKLIQENIEHNKNDADLYALLGYAYLRKKEVGKSISNLKQAIRLSENNTIYHLNLAKAYLESKNTSSAISEAKKVLKLKPNSQQARQVLVSAYFSKKDLIKTKELITNWLVESPNSILALTISASFEQKIKNFDKARTQLLKILTIDPYNLIANMNLIRFDIKNNKLDKAYERLSLIVSKQPENLSALSLIFKLATNTNSTDKAIQTLNAIFAQHPLAINSRLILSQIYLNKKQPEKALVSIDDILKIDNKNTKAYLLKAKALFAQNKVNDAKNTYQILASLSPDEPTGYTQLGLLHLKQKEPDQAMKFAKKALAIKSDYIPAHVILYSSAMKTNNKNIATHSINIIKDNTPDSHIPYEMEADYYLSVKNYETAVKKLRQAWSKQQNIQLANKLMQTYFNLKQDSIAFDAWNEIAKKHKNDLKLQIIYSLALQKNKRFPKAKRTLVSQLKNYPENPILLNNLANLYLDMNDKRALETAKKALIASPNSPAVQDTVGWIYT